MKAIVRGLTREGNEVFYTGKAGKDFVSFNRNEAFEYNLEGARNRALNLNKITEIHGIRFIGLLKDGYDND